MSEVKYDFRVGQKIKFLSEKQRYTVRSCNARFAVCTKPFNLKRCVLYTIIDLEHEIRGAENLIFCFISDDQKDCDDALERLVSGETSVSRRNFIRLDVERIDD